MLSVNETVELGSLEVVSEWAVLLSEVSKTAVSVLGVPLNALIFIVVREMNKTARASGMLIIQCLAVVDGLGVFSRGVWEPSKAFLPAYHPALRYVWVCKASFYTSIVTTIASAHLTMALSFDRFLAVAVPVFYKLKMSPRVASVVIAIIVVESLLSAIPSAIVMTLRDSKCPYKLDVPGVVDVLHSSVATLSAYLLPLLQVSIFTAITVCMVKVKPKVQVNRAERSITKPLIVVCAIFVATSFTALLLVTLNILGVFGSYRPIVNLLFSHPSVINESVNFFLLYWTSKQFKETFWKLFGRLHKPKMVLAESSSSNARASDRNATQ